MGTKILNDIHNDIKQLITAITSYEENEEGFKVCERFCMSNIKHHRYLSVNSNATKAAIKALTEKFSIHGKYQVAKKFQEIVDTFLSSFDFEQHPQYDLQWCLLTLLLNLSSETHKSDLECLKLTKGECTFNTTIANKNEVIEEIDWAEYLKEGQQDFFCDYKSDTESEFSDDLDEDIVDSNARLDASTTVPTEDKVVPIETPVTVDKLSVSLSRELESRNWLTINVQNSWWNELEWRKYPVNSKFCEAYLCELWHKATDKDSYELGTLSEYQTSRELLWMFYVQAHMLVFQKNKDSKFSIRPNISIPSLTITAFNSILLPFCEYFSMMHSIEQFGIDLYANHSNISKKPPLTYEAYNSAVQQHLNKLRNDILTIEKDLMKQDNTHTFLSVSTTLQKRLNTIRILNDIHESVISDWKSLPNWKCTSKLLSGIYFEMQNSHSRERVNICADLYLSSLTVYLNIIDTWLSEGRLEDWRDEFVIKRALNMVPNEVNNHNESLAVRPLDDVCLKDPILKFLIKKVQHMGHSIELLISLDRITDIWKVNICENETRTSLVKEFFGKLEMEIAKYSPSESDDERKEEMLMSLCQIDGVSLDHHDEDIEKNVIQQLSEFNNPFLMKALEDHIPPVLLKRDNVDARTSATNNDESSVYNLFERFKRIECILPFRKILEVTLSDILFSRYNSASKLVKDIMMKEYKLEFHLTLMRSIYMMEAGHIMCKFYEILFKEIESNHMWSNSYILSCTLSEILSQQWPDSSSRWSVTVSDTSIRQVLLAVDNITLHYAVGWPVNIMLNENAFKKYNEIFRFQLKLKWALWTLNNLRFNDLEGPKTTYKRNKLEQFQIKRLESLRFWLLHAIGSIHAYLSGQVLQNMGFVLQKALAQADSLDTIISVHDEYLWKVHEHCLLTAEFEDLMATINNLIEMCSHLRNRWNDKKIMYSVGELDTLESSYVKYHTYLALALHNAVQNKDANYYDLMPQRQTDIPEQSDTSIQLLNDLSRSLLMEVAHQNLPPSGLSVPIPKLIHNTDWYKRNCSPENSFLSEINLNEYEQTFSYIRWYQREEYFLLFNSFSYFLCNEMKDLINDVENLDAQ